MDQYSKQRPLPIPLSPPTASLLTLTATSHFTMTSSQDEERCGWCGASWWHTLSESGGRGEAEISLAQGACDLQRRLRPWSFVPEPSVNVAIAITTTTSSSSITSSASSSSAATRALFHWVANSAAASVRLLNHGTDVNAVILHRSILTNAVAGLVRVPVPQQANHVLACFFVFSVGLMYSRVPRDM